MYADPIVQEIHRIRKQLCQEFQFDIRKIFADVKQREQQHREKVVNLPLKKERAPDESL